jgi:diguanylate cyclase (GGDEF)-like protein/PAS domain S-box-containing protein
VRGDDRSDPPAWLGAIVEQGREGVAVFDAAGTLVYSNPAVAAILRWDDSSEVVGTNVLDLVHPDDVDRIGVNLTGIAEGARPRAGMVRVRRGDGTWLAAEMSPFPLTIDGRDPAEGLTAVVMRDVGLQDAHWHFLAALSSGEPFGDCLTALATGLSSSTDGPLVIAYDDGDSRVAAGPLPAAFGGIRGDGQVDTHPTAPWTLAMRTLQPAWSRLDALPPVLAAQAEALGAAACIAVPVIDPGSGFPAMLVQYPPHPAMGPVLTEALSRRPRQAVSLALERRHDLRQLEHLAHHDDLSGLANRAHFFARLEEMSNDGAPIGVCYIDLDRFKPINDTFGHVVGDHTIIVVARRLERLVRPGDVIGRLGGDEFAIAVPHIDAAALESLASRIVEALARPFRIGRDVVTVGASVGCARTDGEHPVDAVVAAADSALYEAKRAGRGTWRRANEVIVGEGVDDLFRDTLS